MQFGDDWPGVFIRGDNAAYCLMLLQHAIDEARKADMNYIFELVMVQNMLSRCVITPGRPQPKECQMLKAYDECVAKQPLEKG